MRIEHVAIWTTALEELRSFYERYLGARAGRKYVNPATRFESYFLQFPTGARLELMSSPALEQLSDEGRSERSGYAHLAFAVGSEEAVDALTEVLRADGYRIAGEPRRTGDGYYESVVLDPDGNRIEITV